MASIAYLPFYGGAIDPITQEKISKKWAKAWQEVYPTTRFVTTEETAGMLFQANLTQEWLAFGATFAQAGQYQPALLAKVCQTTQTDAVLQPVVYYIVGGEAGSPMRLLSPLAKQASLSEGSMALMMFSCRDNRRIWQDKLTTEHWYGYTKNETLEYMQDEMIYRIRPDAPPQKK